MQEGAIVLPKSVHKERIEGNLNLFDFELNEEEMDSIRELDKGKGVHDPDAEGISKMLLDAYKIED